jgi:hypothetical protein
MSSRLSFGHRAGHLPKRWPARLAMACDYQANGPPIHRTGSCRHCQHRHQAGMERPRAALDLGCKCAFGPSSCLLLPACQCAHVRCHSLWTPSVREEFSFSQPCNAGLHSRLLWGERRARYVLTTVAVLSRGGLGALNEVLVVVGLILRFAGTVLMWLPASSAYIRRSRAPIGQANPPLPRSFIPR